MPFTSRPTRGFKCVQSLLIGLFAVSSFATSANALSCMRPDLAKTMENAKASDDIYYILVGSFQSPPVPKTWRSNDPNAPMNGIGAHTVNALFEGRILSNDPRYDSPVTRLPIDIAVSCAGPWCGRAPENGQEVIAFTKVRPAQAMVLEVGACPDKVFQLTENKAQISKLRWCFENSCVSEIDPRFDRR